MSFSFESLEIDDVVLIESEVYSDERGHLYETYDRSIFIEKGIKNDFVHEFRTRSKRDVIRGLHYQRRPYEQAKLISCPRGKVLDVAIDLRPGSPTYSEYVSRELSEENIEMMFIPRGFAHGFLSLSSPAEVHYKTDNDFAPEYEAGVVWNDPTIDIDWGHVGGPIVSEKDGHLPTLEEWEDEWANSN